jgi:MFS family permease
MPFFGAVVVFYQSVSQVVVQQNTPNGMHGRMMSLLSVGTLGTGAVGGIATGWITDAISPRASLALGGITPLVCALCCHRSSSTLSRTGRLEVPM